MISVENSSVCTETPKPDVPSWYKNKCTHTTLQTKEITAQVFPWGPTKKTAAVPRRRGKPGNSLDQRDPTGHGSLILTSPKTLTPSPLYVTAWIMPYIKHWNQTSPLATTCSFESQKAFIYSWWNFHLWLLAKQGWESKQFVAVLVWRHEDVQLELWVAGCQHKIVHDRWEFTSEMDIKFK